MSTKIGDLPVVTVDFTNRGPGMHVGMTLLERLLAESREGFMRVDVIVGSGTVPVIMARSDLYVLGFQTSTGWMRFSDADWPLTPDATSLGYDGQYKTLGGLEGSIDAGAIEGIGRLLDPLRRPHWKGALRTLLVVVAECARLIPVRMRVLGLLNGYNAVLQLSEVEGYIKNWSKASKGADMSVEVAEGLRAGFKDPTIIRR